MTTCLIALAVIIGGYLTGVALVAGYWVLGYRCPVEPAVQAGLHWPEDVLDTLFGG